MPVGSTVYEDLERLEVRGLIDSALLSSKPFSRNEAARLLTEAKGNLESLSNERRPAGIDAVLKRLENEFKDELSGGKPTTFLRPASGYTKFLYSGETPYFTNRNNKGDSFVQGANLRAGFILEAELMNTAAFYFNPEYRLDGDSQRGRVQAGYATLGIHGVEVQIGRDSLWWGSGFHGGLLMTDNAKPFDIIKLSSEHPFIMPWVFKYLGLIRPTLFVTRLEENRDFPNANLLGMRLDLKPARGLQIGLSRVFLFGGEGRKGLTASDWVNAFTANDSTEHTNSPTNGDQIAAIDVSYVYVNDKSAIPFSGIKIYTEWGAEDSSGKTKTPTARADIFGAFIDEPFWLKNTDFRIEWANTARNADWGPSWYHHFVYSTGYTYESKIIGHHMGADSQDLFARAEYHLDSGTDLGFEFDRERTDIHSSEKRRKDWYAADVSYPVNGDITLSGGAGLEKDLSGGPSNAISWLNLNWLF